MKSLLIIFSITFSIQSMAGITLPASFECSLGGVKITTNRIYLKADSHNYVYAYVKQNLNTKDRITKDEDFSKIDSSKLTACKEVVSGQNFPVLCPRKDNPELIIVSKNIGGYSVLKASYKGQSLGDCHYLSTGGVSYR